MFNIGDLIIYSAHGICRIDDICEKRYFGDAKNYYVLHPIENSKLEISTPVDNEKVNMLQLMDKNQAEEILASFKLLGAEWIEIHSQRAQVYYEIVKTGNRKEISKIANTLMRKRHELESQGRKFYEQDDRLLTLIQKVLFEELAMSLNTTFEAINERIIGFINSNEH